MVEQTTTIPANQEQYVAIVPMTFEERYKMYMRCKKEELAKMLASRDEHDNLLRGIPQVVPMPYPGYPCPIGPYYEYPHITCESNEHTTIA